MLTWEQLNLACGSCQLCELGKLRNNIVIGKGNKNAPVMFIGEGPGEKEDLKGEPFVGAAGQLLDVLLDALMFRSEEYYIANIVKCRPPNNRVPSDKEAERCLPYLRNQVALIRPRIIVCLGSTAAKYVISKDIKITQMRGKWHEQKGCWIMPTFHPAALLRDSTKKVPLFSDIKAVKAKLSEIL
ncbi:DNA polymerase [Ruminiclostridium sufflavum DSM 19573]|uniref:Type-4 uracil-DNA glycosylase n=1 Tax=Ruminiclostridium sufflavum DSM 19573 TaxID=1121337 RepID=A0A318XJQ4_9FIRM|nr:uracil-DNA glycosylase [Ruminiclostridium sufflavum]PYG86688.1 DNA polymerase [Ruminiclostridium sufflavum DSM 19573]